jgi:hypothetical protein
VLAKRFDPVEIDGETVAADDEQERGISALDQRVPGAEEQRDCCQHSQEKEGERIFRQHRTATRGCGWWAENGRGSGQAGFSRQATKGEGVAISLL